MKDENKYITIALLTEFDFKMNTSHSNHFQRVLFEFNLINYFTKSYDCE